MPLPDDPSLLELMLADRRSAEPLYQPTNYWAVYEKTLLPELRRYGLRNSENRKDSVLSSFGGTDLFPDFGVDLSKGILRLNRITRRIPLWKNALSYVSSALRRALPFRLPYEMSPEDMRSVVFERAASWGEKCGAPPLGSLALSPGALRYYMEYAYCRRFIDFDRISVCVELGSGAGRQAELLKRLHPGITLLLFDLPPQLYVAEQRLKAVFPEAVVSYRKTRDRVSLSDLPRTGPGKVYLLGNWKFPLLREIGFDLFWNSASFQEMEPEVAANYLSCVNGQAKTVFLHERMGGKEVAKKKGKHGVLRQTTLEDYKKGLGRYALVDLSAGLLPFHPVSQAGYQASFWRMKPVA